MKEKTLAEKLREELAYNPKNGGLKLTDDQLRRAYEFCDDYKEFLNAAKTEREAPSLSCPAPPAQPESRSIMSASVRAIACFKNRMGEWFLP